MQFVSVKIPSRRKEFVVPKAVEDLQKIEMNKWMCATALCPVEEWVNLLSSDLDRTIRKCP